MLRHGRDVAVPRPAELLVVVLHLEQRGQRKFAKVLIFREDIVIDEGFC